MFGGSGGGGSRPGSRGGGSGSTNIETAVAELRARQENLDNELLETKSAQAQLLQSLNAEGKRFEEMDTKIKQCSLKSDEALKRAQEQQLHELEDVRDASERSQRQADERLDAMVQELAHLRQEVADLQGAPAPKDAAPASAPAASALEEILKSAQAESEKRVSEVEARCNAALALHASKVDSDVQAAVFPVASRCEALQGDLDGLAGDLGKVSTSSKDAHAKHMEAFDARVGDLRQDLENELQASRRHIEQKEAEHFASLDHEVKLQLQFAQSSVDIAKNVFTRSIVWQARDFKKRLAALLHRGEKQAISSPGFSLCSLSALRLEVLMAQQDIEDNFQLGPSLPLPGSCSVGLWGPPGLRVVFQLTIGEGQSAMSRRFEHTFQASERIDSDSRVMFVIQNYCQLNQVWVRDTDMVRVGFDLLEFEIPPVVPLAPKMIPCPPPAVDPETGEEIEQPEEEEKENEKEKPFENLDTLSYARLGTAQELQQERLSNEILAVKNRSVRRVEWRLGDCARLLDSRVGEALDSPLFSASGLEKIQLHFYPRDVTSSGSVNQPCALYVSGPSRTFIKGVLWVGANSRPLEHRFQRRGDTAGRSRFCLLENQIGCNDDVVLALDITEVEVDLPDQNNQSLCLRDARPAGVVQTPASREANGPCSPTKPVSPMPVNGTKGSVRMKRGDPSRTEELVKCVSLPTLNARQLRLPHAKGSTGSR